MFQKIFHKKTEKENPIISSLELTEEEKNQKITEDDINFYESLSNLQKEYLEKISKISIERIHTQHSKSILIGSRIGGGLHWLYPISYPLDDFEISKDELFVNIKRIDPNILSFFKNHGYDIAGYCNKNNKEINFLILPESIKSIIMEKIENA